ncbi:MAG TPA: HAD family hydrolase [Planctomycetota bacterium]|nr:HAD family hydrolase [Planctomycetota bacterium]
MTRRRAVLLDFGNTLVGEGSTLEASDRQGGPVLEAHLARRLADGDAAKVVARFLRLRREGIARARGTLVEEPATGHLRTAFEMGGLHAPAREEIEAALDVFFAKEEAAYRSLPGALEAVEALRAQGARLGLVSNNTYHAPIARTLERLGLRPHFDVLVSSSAFGLRKPDPRIFRAASDYLGAAPEECVHVGDLPLVDVAGARAAGMKAVLARVVPTLAAEAPAEGPEPDAVVEDLRRLPEVVRALLSR